MAASMDEANDGGAERPSGVSERDQTALSRAAAAAATLVSGGGIASPAFEAVAALRRHETRDEYVRAFVTF